MTRSKEARMKKVFVVMCMLNMGYFSYADEVLNEKKSSGTEEFQKFGEPNKLISGAYWGIGVGLARIQHKVDFWDGTAKKESAEHQSSSAAQTELSLLMGFGAPFYKRYYIGLELEFFKRFSGSTKDYNELHIHHCGNSSFNFEARVGYLFPKSGNLVFATAGMSRIFGRTSFGKDTKKTETSFGSFFPTIGCGFEHKINHNWNFRVDARYVISSKENEQSVKADSKVFKYEGKANRVAVRIAITRSINTGFF